MKLPSVSIIIPTLNRREVLKEALFSLNKVAYPRRLLEVIVVSDGSSDGTNELVPEIKGKLSYKLVFIKEKKGGISHAKNTAIKKAKGEIIVSTDDDCLFEKNWLAILVEPFKDASVGAVGGPDRAQKNESLLAKAIDYAFNSFIGSGGIHGRFLKVSLGKFYPVGCNMAFSRKVVQKIGFFDEKLAPGEETDFNHRIERAGFKLVFVPGAFVWHRPRASIRRFIPYILKRGAARVEIIRRHHEYAELIYFLPAVMVLITASLLVISIFNPLYWPILATFFGLYLLITFTAGLAAFYEYHHPAYLFLVPLLIFMQHLLHGLGFLGAVIKSLLKR